MGILRLLQFIMGLRYDLSLVVFLPLIRLWKLFDNREFDEYLYCNKPKTNKAILLVHGSGANEGQFVIGRYLIDKLLEGKGIKYRVYSTDLNTWSASTYEGIDVYAARLANKVEKIKRDGVSELVLVGHSMGGLVTAHYVENYCVDKSLVKRVVTIATPWHGAPLLTYMYGWPLLNTKRHAEMTPDSRFLTELRDKVNKSNTSYKTIGSKWDVQVPTGYYSLFGRTNVDTIYGHTFIIMVKSTWEYVLSDL